MIFIHDTVIDPIGQRGVDRVFENYLSAFSTTFPDQVILYSDKIRNSYHNKIIYPPSKFTGRYFSGKLNNYFDRTFEKLILNFKTSYYYSPYFGTITSKAPQVFSAYDMIYEKFPQYFPGESEKRFIGEKKSCFERASLIICISQSTANDLIEIYPNLEVNKIRVVHLGVSEEFFTEEPSKNTQRPYFLYVGTRAIYKNFLRLLESFGKLKLPNDFYMHVVSPYHDFPTNQEAQIIHQYHLEGKIVFESNIPDSLLQKRYQNAFAYIFPSEYEGFGLPLIEAMASNTLVISSNSSSLPEIGADIPIYFNPNSVESIMDAIKKVVEMGFIERRDRINKGRKRAADFTWKNSQSNFIKEFKTII